MTMTIEQFRATGRDVDDLGPFAPGQDVDGLEGRVYLEGLYIEKWVDDRFGKGPPGGEPHWLLTIGRDQYQHTDLAPLEVHLFDFAVAEEIICPKHVDTGRGVCANCQSAIEGSPYA